MPQCLCIRHWSFLSTAPPYLTICALCTLLRFLKDTTVTHPKWRNLIIAGFDDDDDKMKDCGLPTLLQIPMQTRGAEGFLIIILTQSLRIDPKKGPPKFPTLYFWLRSIATLASVEGVEVVI